MRGEVIRPTDFLFQVFFNLLPRYQGKFNQHVHKHNYLNGNPMDRVVT